MRLQIESTVAAVVLVLGGAIAQGANLVPNGDFTNGDTGFDSDFSFVAFTPCGNTSENQYTIGTDPATWNCSTLVVSVGDHTTGNGNMFVANGGETSLRVWFTTTAIPVAPDTDYFFEGWILNWSSTSVGGDAAQLTFRANGEDLATATATGVGIWTPVSTAWNSGAATSVVLSLFNSTPTVVGNDFAVDDIVFDISSSIFLFADGFESGGTSAWTTVE